MSINHNDYRSIFISDTHIGLKYTNIQKLNTLLRQIKNPPQYIYLVGDIIDGWKLKRKWNWTDEHNEFFQLILNFAMKGSSVIYIRGNHDDFLKNFFHSFGSIKICEEEVHTTASGKKILVLHGDQFDNMIRYNKILTWIADVGYNYMISVNFWINSIQSKIGVKKRWSFSRHLKQSVKNICMYISCFEQTICRYAKDSGCDGVICGHIHNPSISIFEDVYYYNCGDWLEDSSLIVEQKNGQINLIQM